MKDLNGYLERMDHSINKDEKLFFLDKINLFEFDTFVDFGGATGDLIKKIQEYLTIQGHDISNKYFYIVDNNPQMQMRKDLINCQRAINLETFEVSKSRKTLLILSSVCHELPQIFIPTLIIWAEKYADTIIIRDMYFDTSNSDVSIPFEIRSRVEKDPKYFEMINLAPSFYSDTRLIYEYFLKYSYVENWDTEKLENYLSNNASFLIGNLTDSYKILRKPFVKSYFETYTLPYKKMKVKEDFNYDMILPTHVKAILTRIKEKE